MREMLEIPKGTANYLPSVSYNQCWDELLTIPLLAFHGLKTVMYRGELPQFLNGVRQIVENSEILVEHDRAKALAAISS